MRYAFMQNLNQLIIDTFTYRVSIEFLDYLFVSTVKLGNKERFDKELIGIKEPFPVTNLPFTS